MRLPTPGGCGDRLASWLNGNHYPEPTVAGGRRIWENRPTPSANEERRSDVCRTRAVVTRRISNSPPGSPSAMPTRRPERSSRPLWPCPQCGRRFANRNQSHSCGQFTVEQLLEGKPQGVIELYDRLAECLQRCGE